MEKKLNSPQNEPKKKSAPPNDFLKYTGMATKMAVVILAGVYFGRWLDKERDFPLFTLIFSIVSVAVAIYIVIKDTSK
jgi:ATP synthase protein I